MVNKDNCWLYAGTIDSSTGYGKIGNQRAHRVVYENLKSTIPTGLVLDHLCRVRHCINPEHLEPVSVGENCLRGDGALAINARKTHCIHGHEFTADNMYRKRGWRICKTCHLKAVREYKARRK